MTLRGCTGVVGYCSLGADLREGCVAEEGFVFLRAW